MADSERMLPPERLLGRTLMGELRTQQLRDLLNDLRGGWAAGNPTYRKLVAAGLSEVQIDVVWDLLVQLCDNMCIKFVMTLDDLVRADLASISFASEEQPATFTSWQEFVTIESYGLATELLETFGVDAASVWSKRHTIVPLATEKERNEKRGRWK